jgi:membrane-bound serine protease (ClpP class)
VLTGSLCSLASFVASVYIAFHIGQGVGIAFIVGIVLGMPVLIIVMLKVIPHTRVGAKLVRGGPLAQDVDATAVEGGLRDLVGRKGRTLSVCRPAGTAEINRRRYDVVSEGLAIPEDAPVEVVQVEGNRIVVRELGVADLERTK